MKCLIDYKIINNEENIIKNNIESDYKNNVLTFIDTEDKMKITINKDSITMERDNTNSRFVFNFIKNKKTDLEYFIKMFNSYLDGKVLTNTLIIEENHILIEYELWIHDEYIGKFKYELNIKEM